MTPFLEQRAQTANWLVIAALVPASLLAVQLSPSATVLNQLVALFGWGLALTLASGCVGSLTRRTVWLLTALGTYALAAMAAQRLQHASTSIMESTFWMLAAGAGVVLTGASHAAGGDRRNFVIIAWAFVAIGIANTAIAAIQVFWPNLPDGTFIAAPTLPGRAVGNLRQPNHLSTLALWSAVFTVPLCDKAARRTRTALALLFALFIFTVELSASRTGMVGVIVLGLWGALDRRLTRFTRLMLLLAPVVYVIGWIGMDFWASQGHHTFGARERLDERDISSSRFGIWLETMALIRSNPWTGVGVNEFNFAWTLTPFPGRPTAFFDHCHNLILEILVELGIPVGSFVILLLVVALWQAYRRTWSVTGPNGVRFRAAFIVVLLVTIHSLLEYPLWYAYFLLPTAWAWGYCLGTKSGDEQLRAAPTDTVRSSRAFFVTAGMLMTVGALWAFQQYLVVSLIFEPGDDKRSLAARVADGQKSVFYNHHADYATVTVIDHPSTKWEAFAGATHVLLDTRLMIAWAIAFAERGDVDHARYLAQRLKEFNKPEAAEFFAPCNEPTSPEAPKPFQCEEPSRPIDWREFRDPSLYRQR